MLIPPSLVMTGHSEPRATSQSAYGCALKKSIGMLPATSGNHDLTRVSGVRATLGAMVGSNGSNPFADTEDQAALRQLARDVAERELAPMARHGDETEEFPQWAWDGMRKAELFGITIGERWGGAGPR